MRILTIRDTRQREHSINIDRIERIVASSDQETELHLISGQTLRVPLSRERVMTLIERLRVI